MQQIAYSWRKEIPALRMENVVREIAKDQQEERLANRFNNLVSYYNVGGGSTPPDVSL